MTASPSFLGLPDRLAEGRAPRAVIFGAGHGSTYPGKDSSGYALAADAIRAASKDDAPLVEHWDFDLGGPLFDGKPICCVDAGDNRARIETKTREVLSLPAVPILVGGDDSVVIPFLGGFADHGPIWILQIDAHIDWREERYGERFGFSSTMRRASEMAHVAGIVQVGMRGLGSARAGEVEAARAYGAHLVTAREIHRDGIEAALRPIPSAARVVITLDCDGMDAAIMPAVVARTPSGLSYTQIIELIAGASARGSVVGFDMIEFHPPSDFDGLSALTAARILVNVIGRIARQP